MGRHSAPDDDEDDATVEVVAASARAPGARPRPGRHADPADTDGSPPGPTPSVAPGVADAPPRDADDTDPGGLALLEQALHDPDTGPNAVVAPPPGRRTLTGGVRLGAAQARTRPAPPASGPSQDEDDAAETVVLAKVPTADVAVPEAHTAQIPTVTEAAPPSDAASAPATPEPSDLTMLRRDRRLAGQVVAAVVLPFVVYVVVLLALGSFTGRTALIWIWVPLVSAGVVAGLLLDLAHRRARRADGPSAADPPPAA